MRVDLLIIDYKIEGFNRYAVELCRCLRSINADLLIAGCYIEETNVHQVEGFDFVFCAKEYKVNPYKIYETYQPRAIMTFAHRVFDYLFTFEAHKMGIKVFNFQHGLYQTNTTVSVLTKENAFMLLKKKSAQIRLYLKCLYYMSEKKVVDFTRTVRKLFMHQSIYSVIRDTYGSKCNADVSFIYGEYWKKFYVENYHETNTKFEVVGYPELEDKNILVDKSKFENSEPPVLCYVAQSSVEDAILEQWELEKFLAKLESVLENYNLIIKFHPRSDLSMYKNLLDDRHKGKVYVWDEKDFPIADGYIGHESAVLARAMYITDKVLIARLRENRISVFERYSRYICEIDQEIITVVNEMMKSNYSFKNILDDFAKKNDEGSLMKTAEIIVETL